MGSRAGPTPTPDAPAPPISLADYRQQIDRALAELNRGDLAAAKNVLSGAGQVEVAPGDRVVLRPLLDGAETPGDARSRLQLVAQQLAAAERDDAAARLAVLQQIIAQPAHQARQSFLELLRQWLKDLWARLFPNQSAPFDPLAGSGAQAAGRVITWVLAGLGGLLVVLLLGYWFSRLLRAFVADAEARRRSAESGEPQTAEAALGAAAEQGRAGNYRQAVRLLYLSLLLDLEDHGLVRRDRSLTNREVLERVQAAAPPLAGRLQPVVRVFDDVWYGVREPDAETYATYEQEVAEARRGLASAANQPPSAEVVTAEPSVEASAGEAAGDV